LAKDGQVIFQEDLILFDGLSINARMGWVTLRPW
jgi:hypothetical protein